MLLRIRSIFLFFLLFFSFSFSFSQTIQYNQYRYTSTFLDRVRGVGAWLLLQARLSGVTSDVTVPIRIKVGYAWDWIMIYWTSGGPSKVHILVGENVRCGRRGTYNVTFIRGSNTIYGSYGAVGDEYYGDCGGWFYDNVSYCYTQGGYNYCSSFSQLLRNFNTTPWNEGRVIFTGAGYVSYPATPTRRFRVWSDTGIINFYRDGAAINLPVQNISGSVLYLEKTDRDVERYRMMDTTSPVSYSSHPYYSDYQRYIGIGYIDAENNVIGSSTTYEIPLSSFSQIILSTGLQNVYVTNMVDLSTTNMLLQQIRDRISTSPVSVSVDLSTTNNILSRVEQHLSSEVYVSSVGLPSQVFDTLHQASTTIFSIYDDIKSWFSVNFGSDTWDCVVRFGSFSFLGFSVSLPNVDLCSDPPGGLGLRKFFDLLVFLIRFSVIGWAIHILLEGFSSG